MMEIKVYCVVVCLFIFTLNSFINGFYVRKYNPIKRNSRSPGTYVADEAGNRVVIITLKSSDDSRENQEEISYTVDPSKLPGALKIIEVLRDLGIPGLPVATTEKPEISDRPKTVIVPYAGVIGGAGFGADLAGGLVGGGFAMRKQDVLNPEN